MKTKEKVISTFAWCAFLCVLLSCSSELEVHDDGVYGRQLTLGVSIESLSPEEAGTRGADLTSDNLSSIGLIGRKKLSDGSFSTPSQYIDNGEVTKPITTIWRTDYSWPTTDEVSLYAYAPYAAPGLSYGLDPTTGVPFLSYSLPAVATSQKDLVVAQAENQVRNGTAAIDLSFDHICAKVVVALGTQYKVANISKISFVGVKTNGNYMFGDTPGWANVMGSGTVYQTVNIAANNNLNTVITDGEMQFMMIPQEIAADAELLIEYSDGQTASSKVFRTSNIKEWEAGQTYRYDIEHDLTGSIWNFTYTGAAQTFPVPAIGYYKIECWGAQGGSCYKRGYSSSTAQDPVGGKGAYVCGTIYLDPASTRNLYVYVGQEGGFQNTSSAQTFNGGAGGVYASSESCRHMRGGGATDVRLGSNGAWNANLGTRIIVAGAGAGSTQYGTYGDKIGSGYGGEAGGLYGYQGYPAYGNGKQTDVSRYYGAATGGTQSAGGTGWRWNGSLSHSANGSLGSGGGFTDWGSGGGGGYYGGGGGGYQPAIVGTGGGGSSYISGHTGCATYTDYVFTDITMIDGKGYNWPSTQNTVGTYVGMTSPTGASEVGHTGNGYCRITYIGKTK